MILSKAVYLFAIFLILFFSQMFKKYLFVFKFSLASSPLKHQLTFNDLVKKAFGNMMGVVENACRLGLMKNRQLVSPSY